MPRRLDVDAGLALGHLPKDHSLRRVLAAAMARVNIGRPEIGGTDGEPAWGAAHFGLDRCAAFRALDEEQRHALLQSASASLLHEAYFIEKLGLGFGAKMVLLSSTTEERMLYALFSADEARHLGAIAEHIDDPEALATSNPFHALLSDVIENGDKETLTFVIQVVLEGWGLTHYRALADGCDRDSLRGVLRGVLEDEARHHGTGKVLVEERGLGPRAQQEATDVLASFLDMVRPGPLTLLELLERTSGGFTASQRERVLDELDATAHAADRLAHLKKLMSVPAAAPVIDALTARGLFEPMPLTDAARAGSAAVKEAHG
jgi:hypothetical protein